MDDIDRQLVNALQDGIEAIERPFAGFATAAGITETELVGRLQRLLDNGTLTRFGPMFNADRMGGAFTLAALSVPDADFERVTGLVNKHPEVAHNYAREHAYNMWFVVAAEHPDRILHVIDQIERETGLSVLNLPKQDEYCIALRLNA